MLDQIKTEKDIIFGLFCTQIMLKAKDLELFGDDMIFALGAVTKFLAEAYAYEGEGTLEECIDRVKNNFTQGFDSSSCIDYFPQRTQTH